MGDRCLSCFLGVLTECACGCGCVYAGPVGIPELPPVTQASFPALLHTVFPILRLLLLIPLYGALTSPRVTYVPATEARVARHEPSATLTEETSLLVPEVERAIPGKGLSPAAANSGDYGTFRSSRSTVPTTGQSTRAQTPAPGETTNEPQVSRLGCESSPR